MSEHSAEDRGLQVVLKTHNEIDVTNEHYNSVRWGRIYHEIQ
jgi:hypothetical protein